MREAIDSVLAQTFRDFEFIISDNGSGDKTQEICREYAARDPRVRYHRYERNMGGGWNFNNVFRLAKGKYFAWFCHDDIWTADFLEKHARVLDEMPGVVSCYSRATFIDGEGSCLFSVVGRPDISMESPFQRFRSFMKYHTPTNECSQVLGLFRSDILGKTPLMGPYPSSDMILLGEIALRGAAYEIPECLLIRRDHPQKSTNAFHSMEARAEWFDPRNKGKLLLTTWKWVYELHKSVFRCPIGIAEKMKCLKEVWGWAGFYRSAMKKEIKSAIKRFLRDKPVIKHVIAGR
ncbi:MAG: glycosyltransferase [Deltaproteobacteria bacterium]|nr:glycosyltransferase [Deltaproteobacteria bacterium]